MPLERAALRSSEAQSSSVDQVAHHNGSQVEHQDVVVFVHAPPAGAFAIDCETKFTGEFGGRRTRKKRPCLNSSPVAGSRPSKKWKEEHPDELGLGREWPESGPVGGCCNWGNLEFQCRCGALLGLLEIDCYQYETVTFYQDAIKIVM